jgi:hypothetical protein
MTATMILKEIHALPVREKEKLLQQLEREREQAEELEDVRFFDKAKREVAGENPERISEAGLFQMIEDIGRRMKTSLSADEMNAARLEGRK